MEERLTGAEQMKKERKMTKIIYYLKMSTDAQNLKVIVEITKNLVQRHTCNNVSHNPKKRQKVINNDVIISRKKEKRKGYKRTLMWR